MGNRNGPLILLSVLLVLTVPVAVADDPVPSTVSAPDLGDVERALDDAERDAGHEAEEVQDRVYDAQDKVNGIKYRLVDRAQGEGEKVENLLAGLLASAEDLARGLERVMFDLAKSVFDPKIIRPFDNDPGDDGPSTVRTESAAALPAGLSPEAAGLAMVVAAGAVGGALLWWTVLQRAVMLGIVPLLSRIAHSEIYSNQARRLISDLAKQTPGLSLNEIVGRTGYSRNAVSYHLFVLEKEDELVSIKDGKYRRYFPRGGKYVNGAKNVVSALRNDTTLRMAQLVFQQPGTIQREVCRQLGTTASAACWHAKRLEELLVIRKERAANTVRYFPGEAALKYDLSEFGLPAPVAAPVAAVPAAPAPAL